MISTSVFQFALRSSFNVALSGFLSVVSQRYGGGDGFFERHIGRKLVGAARSWYEMLAAVIRCFVVVVAVADARFLIGVFLVVLKVRR